MAFRVSRSCRYPSCRATTDHTACAGRSVLSVQPSKRHPWESALLHGRSIYVSGSRYHHCWYNASPILSTPCLTASTEQKLHWLDLNTSFPVDTAIPSNVLRSIAAPADSQWTGTGAFFTNADQTGLYSFGGFLHDPSEHNSTWLFNSSTAQWSNVTVSGGTLNKLNRDSSMSASTTGTNQGLSFINGGWDSTPGMVVFNSDQHQLSWTNQTQNDTPRTLGSSMQYLRYGKAGVLIAFGGYDVSRYAPRILRTQN